VHRLLRRSIVFRALLLAAVAGWAVIESLGNASSHGIRSSTFDLMQRHRLWASAPDPRLLIVDIDERSLAELAPEFGRWPWPRDTLATVLASAEAAGAGAVVFDVLFSDPDRSRPGGDKAFEAMVKESSHSFFSVVRLPPRNDAKSALFLHDLPGLVLPGAGPAGTVAVILPFMQAILDTRRLGTSTVAPDEDGVLRSFAWAERHGTWRLVSLPFAVAAGLGSTLAADTAAHLIVWRKAADAYPRVSFVDVWRCAEGAQNDRCPDLRDRIIVLGATAPSLHDIESSPLKANHAGVDILATLIDNALHGRQFVVVTPGLRLALALAALGAAAAIVALGRASSIRLATVGLPALLAVVGYASLHSERVYLDLAIPAAIALSYLSGIRIYEALRTRRFRLQEPPSPGTWAVVCVASAQLAERFQWRVFDVAAARLWSVVTLAPASERVLASSWALLGIGDRKAAEAQIRSLGRSDPDVSCRAFEVTERFPECLYRTLADPTLPLRSAQGSP
jgi:adenylate cyclase